MRPTPRRRALSLLFLVPALLVAAAPGALAQTTRAGTEGDSVVVITGRVEVPAGEVVGDVIVLDGDVAIDGTVGGDLFVVNGDVAITGEILGTATILNGDVTVADGARIGGDLTTGETADVAPGASIGGDVRRVDFDFVFGRAAIVGALLAWIAVAVSTLALGMLFLAFAPRAASAIASAATTKIGPTIGWGFATFFGIPILAGLAIATLVGIPLGVAILLALALVYAFSAVATAFAIGRALVKPPTSRFVAFLAGWAILAGVSLVPFLGGLAWFASMVFGLGAIAVSIWNARREPSLASTGTAGGATAVAQIPGQSPGPPAGLPPPPSL
jgi:hypothetical protein